MKSPEGVEPIAQIIEIKISFTPQSGQLTVSAPPDNILALGMIAVATEIIHERGRDKISRSGLVRV